MAELNIQQLGKDMLKAAKTSLGVSYQSVKPFADQSFEHLSQNLKMIVELRLDGTINEEQAKLHLDIYKNTVRINLLTIQGLGLLAVEAALNAALDVVRTVINTTIGFGLL